MLNLISIWEFILDLVFPRKSLECLTDNSEALLSTQTKNSFYKLSKEPISTWAATEYYLVKRALYKLKYNHETYLIHEVCSLFSSKISEVYGHGSMPQPEAILFVPPDKKRLITRGFNLPEKLANAVANQLNLNVLDIFFKSKSTKAQAGLTRDERLANLSNVFEVKTEWKSWLQSLKPNSALWLIDDVIASGNTAQRLIDLIWELNPSIKVEILVLARNDVT